MPWRRSAGCTASLQFGEVLLTLLSNSRTKAEPSGAPSASAASQASRRLDGAAPGSVNGMMSAASGSRHG